ncbi:hypothetical protein TSAR_005135 [Trichomalopsis sarcophagae]|uniref:PiggyBac transposable element-derived protein domain-containing protein n=1 Tax=Trichomalopsis sarcophagae TaxID=543379 RepID=A0A232EHD2_9HYME|nr:hypothetical protein TSAR_005135 [Trichomalopsis sarcophagae]
MRTVRALCELLHNLKSLYTNVMTYYINLTSCAEASIIIVAFNMSDRKPRRLSKAFENDLKQLISINQSSLQPNRFFNVGSSNCFDHHYDRTTESLSDADANSRNDLWLEGRDDSNVDERLVNNVLEDLDARDSLFDVENSIDFDDFSSVPSFSDDTNGTEDEVDSFFKSNDNEISVFIRQNCLTSLLKGLIRGGHTNLPSQARTLLGTKKTVANPLGSGHYSHYGYGKPENANSYIEPMISEYLELSSVGFFFNNRKYRVFIRLFTADTLARNYILCFLPHNFRCCRCTQSGKTVLHRRMFLENDSPLRTDADFREGVLDKYRNLLSPLEG